MDQAMVLTCQQLYDDWGLLFEKFNRFLEQYRLDVFNDLIELSLQSCEPFPCLFAILYLIRLVYRAYFATS